MDLLTATPEVATGPHIERKVPQQPVIEQKAEPVQWEFGPCPFKTMYKCDWEGKHATVYDHCFDAHRKSVIMWDANMNYNWSNYLDLSDERNTKHALVRNFEKLFVFTAEASGHVTRLQANFFGEPTQEEDFFFHISFRNDENKTFGPKFKAFCVWKPDRDIAIDEACAIPVFSSVLKRYCVKKDLLMDIDIVKNC